MEFRLYHRAEVGGLMSEVGMFSDIRLLISDACELDVGGRMVISDLRPPTSDF